jgi:hypothetical protein
MSLRSFLRVGSSISLMGAYHFPAPDTYIAYNNIAFSLEGYVNNQRGISILSTPPGGVLHGLWKADTILSTSDERLKKDVEDLEAVLARPAGRLREDDVGSWVLRELRPVAFRFKDAPEAKHAAADAPLRFGFLAQDLERLLPDLVRTSAAPATAEGAPPELKSVVYQDIIAVLAVAMKEALARERLHSARLEALEARVETQGVSTSRLIDELRSEVAQLRARVLQLEQEV